MRNPVNIVVGVLMILALCASTATAQPHREPGYTMEETYKMYDEYNAALDPLIKTLNDYDAGKISPDSARQRIGQGIKNLKDLRAKVPGKYIRREIEMNIRRLDRVLRMIRIDPINPAP